MPDHVYCWMLPSPLPLLSSCRLKARYLTKRPKAQVTISQLKKKVEKYEQQLQLLKEGGVLEPHWAHHHKWIKGRIRYTLHTV